MSPSSCVVFEKMSFVAAKLTEGKKGGQRMRDQKMSLVGRQNVRVNLHNP